MVLEEIKLRRLAGQHLLAPTDIQTVVKDLCGTQAQFLSRALHGLSIRCTEVNTEGLIKSWTNRGTMHLFSVDDRPLFLYEGRTHFLRSVDTLDSDAYISNHRKSYFYIDNGQPAGELPACLSQVGFYQLMLGYEKTESRSYPGNICVRFSTSPESFVPLS